MAHKLLLADDSVTIQRVIELTFADEDVDVVAVGDGKQAIERIQADPPDIVLADVDMPERDGFQVAAFVKQDPSLSHIPVLLLTGAFEPVDEARVRAAGCDGVLVKPFEPQLVIARVKALLATPPGEQVVRADALSAEAPFDDSPLQIPASAPPEEAPDLQNLTLNAGEPPSQGAALDEYFDKLDAALTSRVAEQPAPAPEPWTASSDAWADPAVQVPDPGFASEPFGTGEVSGSPSVASVNSDAAAASADIAQAFDWLLASERGEATTQNPPGAPISARMGAAQTPASRSAAIDAIAEEVTRRVIGRLADRELREQVADIVSGVAERLVREEIERLKALAK